jgi:non-specific serine/threonine protein kinase
VALRARALTTAGWLAKDQNDLGAAEAYLTEATAGARAVGDDRVLFGALALLAEVVLTNGEIERAWEIQAEAQATAQAIDEPLTTAVALVNAGLVAHALDDLERAQAYLEDAVAAHRVSGGILGAAVAQMFLGEVLLARGDDAGAARQFRDALRGYASLPTWGLTGLSLEGFAAATVSRAPEAAARLLGAAAVILERVEFERDRSKTAVYDQATHRARDALGDPAFEVARTAGTQLSWDEVLAGVETLAAIMAEPKSPSAPQRSGSHGLSPRELEVLQCLAEGSSNRTIAEALSISVRTVENHVLHILTKLGVASRTAAATYAVRAGLV